MKTDLELDTPSTTSFASRWSQRKLENSKADLDLTDTDQAENLSAEEETEEQRLEKLNALTDEDMPDVETLNEDSDYSGFMSKNVSEALRKMALQKLFHGKSYNITDGLDEYDGNYTSFDKLDPNTITCDMKHLLQVEAKKLLLAEKEKEEAESLALVEADAEEQITQQTEPQVIETTKNESESMEEMVDLDNEIKADNKTL